ncbi:protease Lon-related BREX system protein BrxL [Candidatus Parcubacteria bacterium]|nr:MAG: protease Lon-related BREX system protein BrxL [Candidatus Parcubacteria bacterium]
MDLLIRSVGLEPQGMDWRLKMHILTRLTPMVERNVNLVELGPRGTGKSFVYREVSPYAILVSGGKTTVANLFYNMATHRMGLVGLWDVVAFDEVAGIKFKDTTALQILKDYMEAGSFSRGKEEMIAEASIVFQGNINVPLENLLRTSHLFQPFPEEMQDMALLDRIHMYIPGWEVPKLQPEMFTAHYGFVVDYLAAALRELRRFNYTDVLNRYFSFGNHLNARDVKAVRKMVSAYLKLFHPHEQFTREELERYLRFAMEGRRRVKEQLKRMGAFEYFQTSFSYLDNETREEFFVGVPEQTGEGVISADPLEPGVVYTAAITDGEKVALHRIEVSRMPGNGKLVVTGTRDRAMKESIVTAFHYIKANKRLLGLERDIASYDFHVQVVDLMSHKEGSEAGVAFFVALYSLLQNKPVLPGLVVLGEMTIQGNVLPVHSLTEALQVAMENGARRVILPMANARHLPAVPPDVLEKVDPIFYNEPLTAAIKAIGLA